MEELTPFNEGLVVTNAASKLTKPIEQYIEELLDESAIDLLLTAPLHLLVSTKLTGEPVDNGNKTGCLELPDDYLRLASFQMDEWKRPVSIPISETHPNYILQSNPYTRGGLQKPVVVIRYDAEKAKRVLEYYSVDANHTIKRAYYIKKVKAEAIQDNLIDALTWLCASKVFQVMEMATQSKAATEQVAGFYNSQAF